MPPLKASPDFNNKKLSDRIVDTQNRDLEDLRLNLADQSALQKRIGEDMALMVVLFAEIESLRRRVK
jgi:hypothetical protein